MVDSLHVCQQLGAFLYRCELFLLATPLLYVVLEATDYLESSRFRVGRTKAQNSLELSEIPDFGDVISLTQPVDEGFIVFVVGSPLLLLGIDYFGPPPGMNVEVIEGRRFPFRVVF